MAFGISRKTTNLTKRLEELANAVKEMMATFDLPKGFSLYNCFNLEKREDQERCKKLERWIADHPEYEEKIDILKISKIDVSGTALIQET
ncbi:hypothetical protein JXJ21_06085 [candidate division KSB1 bacterium]|nr:hypothetical protein [candidate division KSB1 bacterium]